MNWPKATLVNMLTVTIGSLLGLWLKQFFSEDIQAIVFQAVGLGTLLIGIKMALRLPEGYLLIFMFSLIIGAIFGQWIRVDLIFTELSDGLKLWIGNSDSQFSEGLITAFLLFCVGSMTIVGALEEGLQNKRELLYVKSMLDGFSSIALASTYGIGVWFSIIPMLIFQGGMTMFAYKLKHIFSKNVQDSLSAVGGVLIIGISILLLKLGEIILVAATLMRIKAKMLIPRKELDDEGNEIDPREELAQKLIEYKKYKSILEEMSALEENRHFRHIRGNATAELRHIAEKALVDIELESLNLYKLLQTFQQLMKKYEDEQNKPKHQIVKFDYSIEDQQQYILNKIPKGKKIAFEKIFLTLENRTHAIVTFIALLELLNLQTIELIQGEGINNFWLSTLE